MTIVYDLLDQIDHVNHVAGRTRLICRRLNAQRIVSLSEFTLVNVRTFPPLLTGGRSLIENLVVNIGDIAHERDLVAQTLKPATHHVKRDSRTNMADMRRALHGGATHVHADLTGLDWREIRHGVRCGVVQLQIGSGARHCVNCGCDARNVDILRFLRVRHNHESIARIGHACEMKMNGKNGFCWICEHCLRR